MPYYSNKGITGNKDATRLEAIATGNKCINKKLLVNWKTRRKQERCPCY